MFVLPNYFVVFVWDDICGAGSNMKVERYGWCS